MFSKRPHTPVLAGQVGLFTGERLAATIAIARHLAAAGGRVAFAGTGVETDERVGQLARQYRGRIGCVRGDVSTSEGARAAAHRLAASAGPVTLWVHTLGPDGAMGGRDLYSRGKTLPSALDIAAACTQAAVAVLGAHPFGHLVHVCPVHEVGSREIGQLALARLRGAAEGADPIHRVAVCAIAVEDADLLERQEPDLDRGGVLASYMARSLDEDGRSELNRIEQRIGILFDDVLSAAQPAQSRRGGVPGITGGTPAAPTLAA